MRVLKQDEMKQVAGGTFSFGKCKPRKCGHHRSSSSKKCDMPRPGQVDPAAATSSSSSNRHH